MLFTHFGVSGPIILTLSGKIVDALEKKNKKLGQLRAELQACMAEDAKAFDSFMSVCSESEALDNMYLDGRCRLAESAHACKACVKPGQDASQDAAKLTSQG